MAKKSSVIPLNEESKFSLSELFFSTTDPIGNIIAGNNVFIRVSQFTKQELIGSPHNIIRHPDMPRIVFKVLWEYLKANKIIIAYVKNMSKEGKYYWVLAAVVPIDGGFLSIRIKPSSEFFKLIPDLYKSLSAAEEANGMNASLELLLQTLRTKGFADYDSFMSKVIVEELKSRQQLLNKQHDESYTKKEETLFNKNMEQKEVVDSLEDISQYCQKINVVFNQLFEEFECLLRIKQMTDETTSVVLSFSDQISILALNSSIETYRLGALGSTLSVISKVIKKNSEEIEIYASSVLKYSKEISLQAQQLGLLTSISKIQSDMINFFAMESLEQSKKNVIPEADLKEMQDNILLLVVNFLRAFVQVSSILNPLGDRIKEIAVFIDLINKIIRDLERSDVLGCIEASRVGEQGQKFVIVFNHMQRSTEETRDKLVRFEKYLKEVSSTIIKINQYTSEILQDIERVRAIAHQLNGRKVTAGV